MSKLTDKELQEEFVEVYALTRLMKRDKRPEDINTRQFEWLVYEMGERGFEPARKQQELDALTDVELDELAEEVIPYVMAARREWLKSA